MSFKENVVIVTGASSGIGHELALQLARQGAFLSLAARNEERLNKIAESCKSLGARVLVVKTDVADEAQCKNLIDKTLAEYSRIDTLINNAGFGIRGQFSQQPNLENFHKVMDVNYWGAVYCTRYALPHILQTKGRIVGISSLLGKLAMAGNSAYSSSKFALVGFFDSLRLELRKTGVTVTTIYPGYVVTEFAENMIQLDGTRVGERGRKFYLGWIMKADRCASLIIQVVDKRKRYLIMTFYGVLGTWLSFFSPRLLDAITCWVSWWNKKRVIG
ncbi:short chain dehydrogenase [Candidatus Saganbacteria bacterium CG08_land_8_20_14_0_20_45_16]|uniref:Short chain dehydrogenase n=1 Tax=Candidatus Saganbacteria bacterium CG08_land_8_20_14_0_20_45_16 TaxID=2014293 RepID=A0A2H0XVG0_UNCSA|nr:MAG: short chain dehydrogenase [Candidatus Saganbacteria bacterium CG08_land_8_20_14_0_20_45_16]